tara:strand:+ start:2879 stop:3289 length:411 start_codon:yes stop_codon:yes gene_type:complete
MECVGYTRWAYLPVDKEPKNNQITSWNPPMLPNLALDDGSSLIVDLSSNFYGINLFIKTTAFSSPVDPNSALGLFSAEKDNSFNEVDHTSWETIREGNFVNNKSIIESPFPLSRLKIFHKGPTIIVTGIDLEVNKL